jgi:hypothetical protein
MHPVNLTDSDLCQVVKEHKSGGGGPVFFGTRAKCRAYIDQSRLMATYTLTLKHNGLTESEERGEEVTTAQKAQQLTTRLRLVGPG